MKLAQSVVVVISVLSAPALAQTSDELRAQESTDSPEYFTMEIGAGTYLPGASIGDGAGAGSAVEQIFGDDRGPMLKIELDGWVYRVPYVGLVGAGIVWGWANYTAGLCAQNMGTLNCNERLSEETQLRLFPFSPLAALRVDVLARELRVPLVLSGKIGPDFVFYRSTGGMSEGSGVGVGLRWAAQVALELDFINPRRARTLDEDWGINHTTLYFEVYGSTASADALDLGSSLAWTIGLGLHL